MAFSKRLGKPLSERLPATLQSAPSPIEGAPATTLEEAALRLVEGDLADRTDANSVLLFGQAWDGAVNACTHVANAMRICRHFGDQLLFVDGIGWHVWGPPWRHDELAALRIVQQLGTLISAEADALLGWAHAAPPAETNERLEVQAARYVWAKNSESKSNLEASLALAAPHLCVKANQLDANPYLLGLPHGVLELDSFRLREHRHSDLITKVTNVDFYESASAPTWEAFMDEVMGGDSELIDFMQRLSGYALLGTRGEHLLPILWGGGANGKSTFLGAVQHVLGEYANSAAPGLLIQRNTQEHPTGLADLQGRRLVVVSESGEAGKLNEEQVKLLTGGDTITARRMRQDFFTFNPTHLLFLQTNHRPKVTGTDEGIWRRLRLVPFQVTIPPERRDPRLPEKLRNEADGILAWMAQGLKKYLASGLTLPEKVRAATGEYRDASDQIGTFLDECAEVGDAFSDLASTLYFRYSQWCEMSGDRPRSQREFGMRLTERGFVRFRCAGTHRWRGLRVADSIG